MTAQDRLQRIAHRGASAEWYENTLRAFNVALDRGADAVELDVHLSRDGEVVVHHDPEVDGRPISSTDWADLAEIELPYMERIPRLEDVLRAVGDRLEVYIELKGESVGDAAIEVARRHCRRFAVHSFDHAAVKRARKSSVDVPRGFLLDHGTPNPIEALELGCERLKARDVWPHFSLVDTTFVAAAHRLRARVLVWTVNTREDAERMCRLGVDGICTDDVRLLKGL